ncbi:hypothetical protein FVE85_3982 [Porphyridium purpureum]|uniref:Uncharacterized protein n=1 Tax=Porphyridium purpureum TaxID=35688 RepID=A0A5J4YUB5_PORPP|nr:hypothetical protein FVE85_3982 [Porphyridium purpureum]|eukprot:POR2475..scf229_5
MLRVADRIKLKTRSLVKGLRVNSLFTREQVAQFSELDVEGSCSSVPEDELKELVARTVMKFWEGTLVNKTHVSMSAEQMKSYPYQHIMEGHEMSRQVAGVQMPATRFVQHMEEQNDEIIHEKDVAVPWFCGAPDKPA